MSKKFLFTLLFAFSTISSSAFAWECSCWTPPPGTTRPTHCVGYFGKFGGDYNACRNGCNKKLPAYNGYVFAYIEKSSKEQCKNGGAPDLGEW